MNVRMKKNAKVPVESFWDGTPSRLRAPTSTSKCIENHSERATGAFLDHHDKQAAQFNDFANLTPQEYALYLYICVLPIARLWRLDVNFMLQRALNHVI